MAGHTAISGQMSVHGRISVHFDLIRADNLPNAAMGHISRAKDEKLPVKTDKDGDFHGQIRHFNEILMSFPICHGCCHLQNENEAGRTPA